MKFVISILVLICLACNADQYEGNAKIIERKNLPDNRLLIKYSFKAGEETIFDSLETRNKIIPHDSLKVIYSISDPRKNTLKLP